MNQDGPIPAVPRFPDPLRPAELFLQSLDDLPGVHVQVGQGQRIPAAPALALLIDGHQVGQENVPGKSVFQDPDRGHQVQSEEGQVGQVIMAQGFPFQMGVDEAESPEARPAAEPEIGEVGDPDPRRASDDDIADVPSTVDQKSQLTVGIQG